MEVFVLAQMIVTHMIDGRSVAINPDQITHMSEARRDVAEEKQLAPGVRCVIFYSDSTYTSSAEECTDIANKAAESRKR